MAWRSWLTSSNKWKVLYEKQHTACTFLNKLFWTLDRKEDRQAMSVSLQRIISSSACFQTYCSSSFRSCAAVYKNCHWKRSAGTSNKKNGKWTQVTIVYCLVLYKWNVFFIDLFESTLRVADWPSVWLTDDWLTDRWLTDWPTDWLTDWLTRWHYILIAWVMDKLADWPTDLLTDWLAD